MELNGGYGTVEYLTTMGSTHDGYLFLAPRVGYQLPPQASATFSLCSAEYGGNDSDYVEAGLSFGAAYALGNRYNLLLRYLHIGYSDARHRNDDFCLGGGHFIADGNLKRLQIGVQCIF